MAGYLIAARWRGEGSLCPVWELVHPEFRAAGSARHDSSRHPEAHALAAPRTAPDRYRRTRGRFHVYRKVGFGLSREERTELTGLLENFHDLQLPAQGRAKRVSCQR